MNKLPRTQFERVAAWLKFTAVLATVGWIIVLLLPVDWSFIPGGKRVFADYHWLVLGMFFGTTFLLLYAKWRGRGQAARHDFKLCTGCRYPLEAHLERGRCPECGELYSIEIVRMRWENAYSIRRVTWRDWLPF